MTSSNEHRSDDHTSNDHRSNDHTSNDHTSNDHTSNDHTSNRDTSNRDTSNRDTSNRDTSNGDKAKRRRMTGEWVRPGVIATRARSSWMVGALALVLATVALASSMTLWRAAEERRALAGNQSAASAAARATVEKMLGYDYRSFDQHTRDVSALLTGTFRNEFVQAATRAVKPLAVQNQAVVLAKASQVSVMSTPDQSTVKILAFVDQRTTSAKLPRPQIDQNRVILTMSTAGGRWLVSKVEAF